ncbi:MAG: hypothetical protein H6681_03430 [Desulfobacteraceae bacterium]|nr:hypothetical protein [Desulfobacteraceae bacterium]MCB9494481.1 hypothetical protein [Desulfobacteraceae bacterium]
MKTKNLLLFFIFFPLVFQSCLKEKEDNTTPFATSFSINQRLKDSNNISFDLKVYFDSEVQLKHALDHQENFFHASQITMQKYYLSDLQGNKLKILMNDILHQVFRGHAVYFEILNLKQ